MCHASCARWPTRPSTCGAGFHGRPGARGGIRSNPSPCFARAARPGCTVPRTAQGAGGPPPVWRQARPWPDATRSQPPGARSRAPSRARPGGASTLTRALPMPNLPVRVDAVPAAQAGAPGSPHASPHGSPSARTSPEPNPGIASSQTHVQAASTRGRTPALPRRPPGRPARRTRNRTPNHHQASGSRATRAHGHPPSPGPFRRPSARGSRAPSRTLRVAPGTAAPASEGEPWNSRSRPRRPPRNRRWSCSSSSPRPCPS